MELGDRIPINFGMSIDHFHPRDIPDRSRRVGEGRMSGIAPTLCRDTGQFDRVVNGQGLSP